MAVLKVDLLAVDLVEWKVEERVVSLVEWKVSSWAVLRVVLTARLWVVWMELAKVGQMAAESGCRTVGMMVVRKAAWKVDWTDANLVVMKVVAKVVTLVAATVHWMVVRRAGLSDS